MNKIHPLACISPGAKLGDGVEIGPFAYIDENVEIGDGCKILPHATIFPYVNMGSGCRVFPGAVLGAKAAKRIPERELRFAFAGVLFVAAVLLVVQELGLF